MTGVRNFVQRVLLRLSPGYRRQTHTMQLVAEVLEATRAQTRFLEDKVSSLEQSLEDVKQRQSSQQLLAEATVDVSTLPPSRGALRDMQDVTMLLLREFHRICREHDLAYWLDFGSLLGAVRHGGFIPWDDDLDVAMPDRDYRRFLEIIDEELATTDLAFIAAPSQIGKLVHRDFMPHGEAETAKFISWSLEGQLCFTLDIFPYYHLAPEVEEHVAGQIIAAGVAESVAILDATDGYSRFAPAHEVIESANARVRSDEPASRLYLGMETRGYQPRIVETSDIFPLSTVEFEGHAFSAPRDIEAYLIDLYGDYMKIPDRPQTHLHWATMPITELKRLNRTAQRSR